MTKDEEIAALRAQVAALTAELDAAKAGAEQNMRPETDMEHVARDMRDGLFPKRSERQMVPARILAALDPAPVSDEALIRAALEEVAERVFPNGLNATGTRMVWALREAEKIRALATPEGIAAIRERAKG
jgi:hypothetical protein